MYADYVAYIISMLPPRKSNLEQFPLSVLKAVSPALTKPLAALVQCVFDQGIMPRCLKAARVIPHHKLGHTDLVTNYRPISLQSVFATIIEKIAYNSVRTHIVQRNVIDMNQFGF